MKNYLEEVQKKGDIEISSGVYLFSRSAVKIDQKFWDNSDPCKHFDFKAPYYILTDSGADPEAIYDEEDLQEVIEYING